MGIQSSGKYKYYEWTWYTMYLIWPLNTWPGCVLPKVGLWLDYLPKEVPSGWLATECTLAVRAGCFLRRQGTVGTYMYSQGKTRCLLVTDTTTITDHRNDNTIQYMSLYE